MQRLERVTGFMSRLTIYDEHVDDDEEEGFRGTGIGQKGHQENPDDINDSIVNPRSKITFKRFSRQKEHDSPCRLDS